MKLKLLLSTSLFLVGTHLAKAQATYGTWVGANGATPFEYNVATGTLGATYASEATAKSSISTGVTNNFLAAPGSGSVKVFAAGSAGPGFTIDGSKLTFAASNLAGSPNKFALYGVANTSAVTSLFFKLSFNNTTTNSNTNLRTVVNIGFGKTTIGNVFENDAQMWNDALPGVFGGFRFQIGGVPNGGVRFDRSATNPTSPYGYTSADAPASPSNNSNTIFSKTDEMDIEIYCNNSNLPKNYTRGANNYTLPARTYNVFVRGILLETQIVNGTTISNLPASSEIGVNEKIDAVFIGGHNLQAGSSGNISISNIKFGWIPQNVLPVELSSFTGKKINKGAQLNWSTAAEKDNAYFEILRASEDGVFKEIDRVDGKGNSNENSSYQFVDNKPLNGTNYYKLKQVDLNGDSKEYGPVTVTFDLVASKLAAFVNADNNLLLTYNAIENANAEIAIVDLNGKKLISQNVGLVKGLNQAKLNVSTLPKGLYVVKIGAKGNNSTAKFIK